MAAKYPRVLVTLNEETLRLVLGLSELTGRSRSAVIGEVLEMALPALQTMLEAAKVLKEKPLEAQRMMNRFASSATAELAQAQLDLDSAIDSRTVKAKRRRNASNT